MTSAVIFYDSTCLLCSRSVQFVLKHDKHHHFTFTSLNSAFAQSFSLSKETVAVRTANQELLTHQHAIRYIIQKLPNVKWVLFFFWITPNFIQKALYTVVAENRKRVFGSTQCSLAQAHKNRFIS